MFEGSERLDRLEPLGVSRRVRPCGRSGYIDELGERFSRFAGRDGTIESTLASVQRILKCVSAMRDRPEHQQSQRLVNGFDLDCLPETLNTDGRRELQISHRSLGLLFLFGRSAANAGESEEVASKC
ncbi:hypothetical protein NGM99_14010 [Mesorhizobium sp. RP14(2022)]|uniref:Uncharacterized protein n=1 Tax=Mesorhizobium liriopis TaxID=2953882 RepID=A0ABT1C7T1_9HYPH|nr:hypothetical protein [Mesorhizobium liriopis]MCO6050895.1 hypothetical protein [Mesorhizobium liriopis]